MDRMVPGAFCQATQGPSMQHTVHVDAEMLARYGLNGPRYTSYPTALSFREDVLLLRL